MMKAVVNLRNLFRKTVRFGLFIPFSNLIPLYFGKYLPAGFVDYLHNKRNRIIRKKIQEISDTKLVTTEPERPSDPLPIWFFWMQGAENLPCIPRLCLNYAQKNANGHPVIVVSETNLSEYVQLPDHILQLYQQGRITPTNLSDIIRLGLLSKYGGLWIDATLFITRPLPADLFSLPFFSIKHHPVGHFVSDGQWSSFCISAWRNHPLILNAFHILTDYWAHEDIQIDYFFVDCAFDLLYHTDNASRLAIDAVPFTNENIYRLNCLLPLKYDEAQFTELTRDTYLFKLSWKTYTEAELTRDPDSYYNHLLRQL